MTREEAIAFFKDMNECTYDNLEPIQMAIEALEQEPCGDAISRQAVIEYIEGSEAELGHSSENELVCQYFKELPPVRTQPKMGRWIEVDIGNCHATLKCSVCDRVIEPTFTFGEYSYEDINRYYPYCHCGAKMVEQQERSDKE